MPPPKRRSYLIDPRFQLKWTALLIAAVVSVMIALGVVIWKTADVATQQARSASTQAEQAFKESQVASKLTRTSARLNAPDSPELQTTLDQELAEVDREFEKNLAEVRRRGAEVEQQRKRLLVVLVAGGGAVLLILALMGILITHRIVGPVYKLKRLIRQVGTARFVVTERLRKGDELEDLFETFVQMTYSLKALQSGRLRTLEATIVKAEKTGAATEVLEGLRALRAQLRLGISVDSLRPPNSLRGPVGRSQVPA